VKAMVNSELHKNTCMEINVSIEILGILVEKMANAKLEKQGILI